MGNESLSQTRVVNATNPTLFLRRQSTYHVDGKSFVVTSVFREEGKETLGSVLLKLIQTEAVKG